MRWQVHNKMNIGQRVRFWVLMGCTLTFLSLGIVGLYGMYYNQRIVSEQTAVSADASADYTEKTVKDLRLTTLETVAKERAGQLNRELEINAEDALVLAENMTEILNNQERYIPHRLADPRQETIHSGQVYLWLAPGLEEGMSPALEREIGLAANMEDPLIAMAKSYEKYRTACFIGSEKGYFICVDVDPENEIIEGFEEQMADYDPRKRPWYIRPPEGKSYAFSEVFVGVEGFTSAVAVAPYYDRDGFAGVAGVDASLSSIQKLVLETSVGHSGFSIALNSHGNVVFSPRTEGALAPSTTLDLRRSDEYSLAEASAKMTAGETGVIPVHFDGEEYYLAYAPMPAFGWSFGTLIDQKEIAESAAASRQVILNHSETFMEQMQQNFYHMLLVMGVVLIFLYAVMSVLSSRMTSRLTKPIKALSEGVGEIAGGNLDKKLDIHTGDELEQLANSFNEMTVELKDYMENLTRITADREREQAELSIATGIQTGLLPQTFPKRNEFEIYASMHPARHVGGDFYDFYMLDENHPVVTIADVSGKGMGAAIFMSRAMTILKNLSTMMASPDDLASVLCYANNQLCQGNEEDMFVTVFMGLLDIRTGEFIYANGGHNPPLLRQGSAQSFAYLPPAQGCMLGIMEDMPFSQDRLTMKPGSMLLLYTDGVTEAMNRERELFSETRLQEILGEVPKESMPEAVLKHVTKALEAHADGAEQSDDITMLGLKYMGLSNRGEYKDGK